MIRKLPRRLGSTRLIFIVTAASILCSVVLYVTLSILLKRFTVVGIVAAVAIPTVVAPSVSYLFVQVLHRLDLAERTLAEINAELELRVEQRAAELVKTNRELQTEIAEREWMGEEARRREAQAALTYEVGRHISGELEWDELFSTVVTTVYDTFQYHSVVLMMLDEKAECLTLQSAAGNYADSIPQDVQLAIGEGMMGRVAMTGEILISGDVSQSPHYARRTEQTIKSELAVPIKSGQKVIAVLGLQSDEFDAFDEIDVLVMKTLAAQVAVAIENAQLYETVKQELTERKRAEETLAQQAQELARSNAFIAALSQVTARFGTTLDPEQVIETLGTELKKLGMTCMIAMLEPDEQALVIRYTSMDQALLAMGEKLFGAKMYDFRIQCDRFSIWTELVEQKRAVFVPDVISQVATALPNVLRPIIEHVFRLGGRDSDAQAIWLPLTAENQVLGGLALWGPGLQESDLAALSVFAGHVAIALQNAYLYAVEHQRTQELALAREQLEAELAERRRAEEAQRRYSERLEILHEIGQATLAALSPETIAQAALNRVRQLISCRGAGVIMFDSEIRTATVLAIDTTVEEPVMQAGMRFSFEMFWDASEIIATLEQGKIHVIENDLTIPQPTPAAQILQAGGIRSVLLAPLIFQEKVVGLLGLAADLPNVFTPEHVDIAREVAHSLGVAIQQVRLREEREVHAQRLEASLQEKEVLLKEVHHRVKNNLQIISSLLSLQSKYITDERELDVFRESRDRVKSMSLAHERLYQSPDLAQIDFAEYIRDLVAHSFRSYRDRSALITLRIDADDVSPGLDTAIPCGLIINELVSNALKHAFPDNRTGEIRIGLHSENDQTILTVSDNGVGFPADLDFRDTDSLGLQLVTTLVEQLEGSIELDNREGTAFKITFTEPPDRERI
jgi:two-component sensor histidine kinase/putative methionine-R-sulfoxide reductase with GAF domain